MVLQQDPKLGAFNEAFLNYLNLKLDNDESKEESDELISGYLEAVNGAFSGSPVEAGAKKDFVKTVYARVCAILRQSDTKSRYKVVVSALQLIKDHTQMFREHLLTQGPIEIFAVLQKLCDHTNRDVRSGALEATDAWLGQIAASLKPDISGEHEKVLSGLWKLCSLSLGPKDGHDPTVRMRCLGIRGYGALAKAAKACRKFDILKMWKQLSEQVKLILVNIATDEESSDAEQVLPDLTIALADFILQITGDLSDGDLDMLNSLCAVLLTEYNTALNSRRFLFHRAFYLLLYSLSQCGRALSHFLDRAVYRQTMESVKPELSASYARPGIPPTGQKKPQPCFRYSVFWASLGDRDGSTRTWLRKRAVVGDLEAAHASIQQQVYTRIWQAVTRMVTKLDFTIADQQVDANDEAHIQADEGDGEAPPDDQVDDGSTGMSEGVVFQASGMTGHEQPQNMRDVEIFLNLVDFVKELLDKVAPQYFKSSCYLFCVTMIKLSSRNPLFSGFFKLLTAAMKSADKGSFFRGLSCNLLLNYDGKRASAAKSSQFSPDSSSHHEGASDKMQVEISRDCRAVVENLELCFVITSKFAGEVLVRTEQCFDDLLVAMLELILQLPREMKDLKIQVPALQQALKQGVSYTYIARVALGCLEKWVDDRGTHVQLQTYLRGILPLLELYFRQQDESESAQSGAMSIDKKISKYKYAIKKKGTAHMSGGGETGANELKDLAIRAVKLLGWFK